MTDSSTSETSAENNASPETISHERIVTICLVIIALCIGGAALVQLKDVLTPLVIAVFMYFVINPIAEWLVRWKWPRWIAYPILTLITIVAVDLLGRVIFTSARGIAAQLPQYQARFQLGLDMLARWTGRANSEGIFDWEKYSLAEFFDVSREGLVTLAVETTLNFVEISVMAVFYLLFLFLEARKLPIRIKARLDPKTAAHSLRIAKSINESIRRYLVLKTVVSLGLGISTAAIGAAFQLDFWLLWGAIAFLLNYITYLGSIAALGPPILIAFLQFSSPLYAMLLATLLTLNRTFWIDYAEIRFSGRHLNVSPLLLLFSIALLGWTWGVLGMVMAVPLVTSAKIVLSHFESTRHLSVLMSED